MIKHAIKNCRKLFLHKVNKTMQKKNSGEMWCTFAGMTSLLSYQELCNFITPWKMIKTTKLCTRFFSLKLRKKIIIIKNKKKKQVKFCSQVPFKKQIDCIFSFITESMHKFTNFQWKSNETIWINPVHSLPWFDLQCSKWEQCLLWHYL